MSKEKVSFDFKNIWLKNLEFQTLSDFSVQNETQVPIEVKIQSPKPTVNPTLNSFTRNILVTINSKDRLEGKKCPFFIKIEIESDYVVRTTGKMLSKRDLVKIVNEQSDRFVFVHAYPFIREIVMNLTVRCKFPALLLPLISTSKLSK